MSLLSQIISDGGFTYNPVTGVTPTSGLALSIYPELSEVIDAATIQGSDIQDYMNAHIEMLQKRNVYVGAWHDLDTGKVFLDITIVLLETEHAQAVALCEQHSQRAYWNIGKQEEVRVVEEEFAHAA